tara:strand:- start:429 stop:752 length:324 start_codon:yes stop_codon:yes gene_type:complete
MTIRNDYDVLFDEYPDEKLARIKLTSGQWQGIVYNYHTIGFVEQDNDDAVLKFEYDIIHTPKHLDVEGLTKEDKIEFEDYLGDILVSIIEETTSDETGTDSNKQPNI